MCLAYGAGLRSTEYTLVTAQHVRQVGHFVVVDVPGAHARTVPVLRDARDDLLALAAAVPREELFSPRQHARNWVSSVLAKVETPAGAPRLSSRRLRTTWMVQLCLSGVRISELADLAAVRTTKGWEDLGRHIPRREATDLWPLIGDPR
jgi:site-specific recombinase XerD